MKSLKGVAAAQNEVAALLGPPSGETMYPLISQPQGHAALYSYAEDNLSSGQRRIKFLAIYIDAAGTVRDVAASSSTGPLPVQPASGGTAFIPIIIPHGK